MGVEELGREPAMTVESQEPMAGKSRRRPATKTASRQSAGKVKSTVHLSVEASQRLTVHAAMLGMDRSSLVEQLIRDGLRRFVVSDRGGSDGASADGQAAEKGRGASPAEAEGDQ